MTMWKGTKESYKDRYSNDVDAIKLEMETEKKIGSGYIRDHGDRFGNTRFEAFECVLKKADLDCKFMFNNRKNLLLWTRLQEQTLVEGVDDCEKIPLNSRAEEICNVFWGEKEQMSELASFGSIEDAYEYIGGEIVVEGKKVYP